MHKTIPIALMLMVSPAAAEGVAVAPIKDPVTKTECSACHMPYPSVLLPARSWDALTNDLAHHFGEDASLAPDVTASIKDYLMANAADAGGKSTYWLGRLPADATPLRITELPWFVRQHGNFSAKTMKRIGVAGNCNACHRGAADGYFQDD
jgi:Dihaem cytochrome c